MLLVLLLLMRLVATWGLWASNLGAESLCFFSLRLRCFISGLSAADHKVAVSLNMQDLLEEESHLVYHMLPVIQACVTTGNNTKFLPPGCYMT